jgi:hypothetical protein
MIFLDMDPLRACDGSSMLAISTTIVSATAEFTAENKRDREDRAVPGLGRRSMSLNSIRGAWAIALLTALAVSASALAAETGQPAASLSYFEGAWSCEGHFANGSPIASNITFSWSAPAQALVKHHDDLPPNGFHDVELWTFDKVGGFKALVADAYSGARAMTSPGWAGDALTWSHSEGPQRSERFIYVRLSTDHLRIDWEVSKDGGSFKLGDTLTCKRGAS